MTISTEKNKTQGLSNPGNDKGTSPDSTNIQKNKSAPPIDETTTNKENLKLIELSHLNIKKIKEDLDIILDSMNQNPSYITQFAEFWGELPLWKKIISGLIVTVPLLLIGIFAHVAVATAISICMIVAFAVNSIALDNHHSHKRTNDDRLKKKIHGLADFIGLILESLDVLRSKLNAQIERFAKSNEELEEHINDLYDEIVALHTQINNLQDTEKNLRATQLKLEKTVEDLDASNETASELFEQTINELEQVKADYKSTELLLNEQVRKLSKLNTDLSSELDNAKFIGTTLQNTVGELSNIVLKEKEDCEIFHKKLQDFLLNENQSFANFAAQISKEAKELSHTKDELQRSIDMYERLNKMYNDILKRQGIQIDRLTKLPTPEPININIHEKKISEQLSNLGIYALDTNNPKTEQQADKIFGDGLISAF
ncbi:MAG: hypothetical protein WC627_07390 [Legionella sp.]